MEDLYQIFLRPHDTANVFIGGRSLVFNAWIVVVNYALHAAEEFSVGDSAKRIAS